MIPSVTNRCNEQGAGSRPWATHCAARGYGWGRIYLYRRYLVRFLRGRAGVRGERGGLRGVAVGAHVGAVDATLRDQFSALVLSVGV